MRAKTTIVLSALFLMLSLLSVAQPAAATPAQPVNASECFTYSDVGVELCLETHGVTHVNESASGTTTSTTNVTTSLTGRENGQVFYESEDQLHLTHITRDGEEQVYHVRGRGEFTFRGETCTYDSNIIFANGEVRHQMLVDGCN